ncbi:MAG: energy transducer TonB, partial [Terracidiphilus sp.]
LCGFCAAQSGNVGMPDSLVIARDTFWDFGPPFNYYDLIQIKNDSQGLAVDQVLVTPHGQACMQPATVEERTVILHKTMTDLLQGRNPCAIPEKELHREQKRCKKCLVFSGVNVMMQVACGGADRKLRMDILDRDIYDRRTQTPSNTSWTMSLFSELNGVLGTGSEEKPIFNVEPAQHHNVPDTALVRAIGDGKFDELFGPQAGVSQIVHEAGQAPPPPPSVEIESVAPIAPVSPQLPSYPPIAKLARVEGAVNVTFDITSVGKVRNLDVVDGPKVLVGAVSDSVSTWTFPESAWGSKAQAAIRFSLNCMAGPSK